MTFPPDTRGKTSPHGDPLFIRPNPKPLGKQSVILWELGSTFVESFLNPESLYFYIRQRGNNTTIVLNVADLAAITKAVADRALNSQFSDAPTGDDLPF